MGLNKRGRAGRGGGGSLICAWELLILQGDKSDGFDIYTYMQSNYYTSQHTTSSLTLSSNHGRNVRKFALWVDHVSVR